MSRTVHVKTSVSDCPPAVAVMLTVHEPALVKTSVPLVRPVDGWIARSGGNPVAPYVMTSPSGSMADNGSEIAVPSSCACGPGLASTGGEPEGGLPTGA